MEIKCTVRYVVRLSLLINPKSLCLTVVQVFCSSKSHNELLQQGQMLTSTDSAHSIVVHTSELENLES